METLTIEFEDHPGSVVVRQQASLGAYFDVREAWAETNWGERASFEKLYAAFAPLVVSWTFDPPPDAAGLAEIDPRLALAIVGAWLTEVRDAPRPLPRRSSATEPSPVQ